MTTLDRGDENFKLTELMGHYDQDDISGSCSLTSENAESPITSNISQDSATAAHVSLITSVSGGGTPPSVDEKRMRREIANSNERRRMQSINAGFQALRGLLPNPDQEKLSKAAILQSTAEYIFALRKEQSESQAQIALLRAELENRKGETSNGECVAPSSPLAPAKKRKLEPVEEEEDITDGEEIADLQFRFERERALRMQLETKLHRLESIYSITAISSNNKLQESLPTERITSHFYATKQEPKEDVVSHSIERHELQCNDGSSLHSVKAELNKPTTPTPTTTSVILQPVAVQDESLLSPTVIGGHQYSAPSVLVNQSVCSPTSIQIKPKPDVERLVSPTSVSLVTTITSTRLTTTTTSNSSSPLYNSSASSPPSSEQIKPSARLYLTSTSRQNLETIVEAIRHLEGESFDSVASVTNVTPSATNQEVPLALTKRNSQPIISMDPFLKFHSRQPNQIDGNPTVTVSTEQQQRPGVIVVKQQT